MTFLNNNITTLWSHGDFNSLCYLINTLQHSCPSSNPKIDIFGHITSIAYNPTARLSN
uniref:Uncharacterized protein n=1 Tax=Rhizophora mucronata TaxID=61149 RepID=A0A2P2PK60_RHIMU